MCEIKVLIKELISSKTADDDKKGDIVFNDIINKAKGNTNDIIVVDFCGIELVNTAFLNNAIGKLFDKTLFDINANKVKIVHIDNGMMELLKETILVARDRYEKSS